MGTVDFDSEPAYWYERTLRNARAAGLPTRSRPAVDRDERLIAQEVARHVNRQTFTKATKASKAPATPAAPVQYCATCGLRFSKRAWAARRLWRVIYPRAGGRIEIYRHGVCPNVTPSVKG